MLNMCEHINWANTVNIALIHDLIFKDFTFLLIVCPFVLGTLLYIYIYIYIYILGGPRY